MNVSHLSKGAALFSRTHKFVLMYQSSLFRRKRWAKYFVLKKYFVYLYRFLTFKHVIFYPIIINNV